MLRVVQVIQVPGQIEFHDGLVGGVDGQVIAHLFDLYLDAPDAFPWDQPEHWFPEAARRLTEWWGLPLYTWGYVGALVAAMLSLDHPVQLTLTLALAAAVYGLATALFRLREKSS